MTVNERMNKIRGAWKELTLVGTWIATIAGSFLLPLPDWAAADETESYSHFILFLSTVLAGFVLLLAFRLTSKKTWTYISVCTLLLFICSFFLYSFVRSSTTLPYRESPRVISHRVIGTVPNPNFQDQLKNLEKQKGFSIPKKDLLMYVGGDPYILWTEQSIQTNKWKLIFSLLFAYASLSVFLIAFMNLLLLFKSNEDN